LEGRTPFRIPGSTPSTVILSSSSHSFMKPSN
jgi:hypothetical protein